MLSAAANTSSRWLRSGEEIFPAMLEALEEAKQSVCLEVYTFSGGTLGQRFRAALIRARRRGAQVHVLIDAVGSIGLSSHFWDDLRREGGEVHVFNPLTLKRFWFRNHRKLLVCDERVAFIGGFNIAETYEGDGLASGWCDLGLRIEGPLAVQLASSFHEMFIRADFQHKVFMRLRRSEANRAVMWPTEQILLSGPGRGRSPIKRALRGDLAQARDVRIMVAYFLPTWRLRRDLVRVVKAGGMVRLILAGKSDVVLSQLAARSLYRRFLKSGVEIYEYQPQVLHAKLIIVDDVVYVGSSNLDQRSLQINYEVMVRFQSREMAEQARALFGANLDHCHMIDRETWRRSRTFSRRVKQRLAYFVLVRVDPYMARVQWRAVPD